MAFCSVTCQSKEASKSINDSYAFIHVQQVKSNTMQSSVGPGNYYQMSYHRSPSLSYNSNSRSMLSSSYSTQHLMQSISSSTSFSSSISDISLISTPCSCEDKVGNICPPYHITRTT